MPDVTTLLRFAAAAFLLAIAPGPSIVLLIAVGTDRGRRAAVLCATGLALGTATWGVVTAAGLGALFATRPDLLAVVTSLGAAYLVMLAVGRFRVAREAEQDMLGDEPERTGRPFRDGLVVNLLNPSLALFLAAVLPPFIDLDVGPAWSQILVLSGLLVTVSTTVNVGWGVLGAAAGGWLRRGLGTSRTTVLVGLAYLGLAGVALWSALR